MYVQQLGILARTHVHVYTRIVDVLKRANVQALEKRSTKCTCTYVCMYKCMYNQRRNTQSFCKLATRMYTYLFYSVVVHAPQLDGDTACTEESVVPECHSRNSVVVQRQEGLHGKL